MKFNIFVKLKISVEMYALAAIGMKKGIKKF